MFGLKFIIFPEKSSTDSKSSSFERKRPRSNDSSQVKKAKLAVHSSEELVLNIETDHLTTGQASESHPSVERHKGIVKVKPMFNDFMNQFKDIKRKIESQWEKKADNGSEIIDMRLNNLEKESMNKVNRLYTEGAFCVNQNEPQDTVGKLECDDSIIKGNPVTDDSEVDST